MHDSDHQGSAVTATSIDDLPCLVQLPASWLERYGEHAPPMEHDQRRFPRLACGSHAKAALEYRATLPSRPRDAISWAVYPVSISRGGLAFLHSEQLFPCEKFQISFADGKNIEIEIARCRRIGPRCFEVGARF